MASVLTVNGVNYNQSARRAHSLLIDAWGWDLDSDWWCEFHEHTGGPQPQFTGPHPVSISVSSTTVFTGDIVAVQPTLSEHGYTWGYRCLGLQYRANWLPVTANDGSGLILFNVDPSDTDNYLAAFAGMSIGQILSYCLTQHSTALTAAGITTDATTASQLAAQTLVPNEQVEVAGERLWQAMQTVLTRWARNLRLCINPAGLVRLIDITTGSSETLTSGTDPIDPPLFSWNWTNCATQVTVRGKGVIEPAYVSQLRGSLTPAWTGTQQTNWTEAAFTNPPGATDHGTITTVGGPTSVTVQSSNASLTWATNYWDTVQGWIYCISTTGSGLTYTEARPITACSSLSAGGTATITLAYALSNSGSSAYNSYQIIGTNVPLSSGGLADVWRLYNVTDPGNWISTHLVRNFPVSVPFVDYFGTSAVLTTTPSSQIVYNGQAGPALFSVDPVHGQILFTRPVVELFTTQANLALGGAHVTAPTDVYMLLAYSRGALTTSYPTSGYSGTAYTAAGLARTQTVDVESWRYGGNTALMAGLAQMLQNSVCNTQMEGSVTYRGYYGTVQDPSAGGFLMNFAGNGYSSGMTSLNIPLRAATYRYMNESGPGVNYITSLKCSTRRDPRTGESYYTHLSQLGSGIQRAGTISAAPIQFAGSILGEPEMEDVGGYSPMLNSDEQRAIGKASSRESSAAARMGASEFDDSMGRAAARVGNAEGQAAIDMATGSSRDQYNRGRDRRRAPGDASVGLLMPGSAPAVAPSIGAPSAPVETDLATAPADLGPMTAEEQLRSQLTPKQAPAPAPIKTMPSEPPKRELSTPQTGAPQIPRLPGGGANLSIEPDSLTPNE